MKVRLLEEKEVFDAMLLYFRHVMQEVCELASYRNNPKSYKEDREAYFQEKLSYPEVLQKYSSRELIFYGAFQGKRMLGMVGFSLSQKRIAYLGVLPLKKEKKIGKELLKAVFTCKTSEGEIPWMQVMAEPEERRFYASLGFVSGNQNKETGQCEMILVRDAFTARKRRQYSWIVVGGIAIVGTAILLGISANRLIKVQWSRQPAISPFVERGKENKETPLPEEDSAMAIKTYQKEKVPYRLNKKKYQKESDSSEPFYVYIDVEFPVISQLGNQQVEKKINEQLEQMARRREREYYTQPTKEAKEWMLLQQHPIVISKVRYQVSYESKEYISVVFEENYSLGDMHSGKVELHTAIFSLKDGKIIMPWEILNENEGLEKLWIKEGEKLYPYHTFFQEVAKKAPAGKLFVKEEQNGLKQVLFLTEKGVELGFSYDYQEKDESRNGYVTIPLTKEELKSFEKDKIFWNSFR